MTFFCPKCETALIKTPSGYCCPNQDSGVITKYEARQLAKVQKELQQKQLADMPEAIKIESFKSTECGSCARYELSGTPGIFYTALEDFGIEAKYNNHMCWFKRDEELEKEMLRILGVKQ